MSGSTIRSAGTDIVVVDGVVFPVEALTFSGQLNTGVSCAISVQATEAVRALVPGSSVVVFRVDSLVPCVSRTTVEVPVSRASESRDIDALRSVFASECERTIGPIYRKKLGATGSFIEAATSDQKVARFTGVFTGAQGDAATGSSSYTLMVRGVDWLFDIATVIQLVGGVGTLTEGERRFYGQDTEREGRPNTLLTGRGRRAFADAITDILTEGDSTLAVGYRRLLAQYAAQINDMLKHKFAHLRVGSQLTALDQDRSVERLIELNAFKRFLREALQGSYAVPLRQALGTVLGFVGYQLVPVLTPPFFPLVPAPLPITVQRETQVERRVGQLSVRVRWERWQITDAYTELRSAQFEPARGRVTGIPLDAGDVAPPSPFDIPFGPSATAASPLVTLAAGEVSARLSSDRRSVFVQLPPGSVLGPYSARPSASFTIAAHNITDSPDGFAPLLQFFPGTFNGYLHFSDSTGSGGFVSEITDFGSQLTGPLALHPLRFSVIVESAGSYIATTTQLVEEEVAPPPQTDRYDSRLCRLGSLAILPELWWAVPPACNVLTPESIESEREITGGVDRITRLLAKIPPGRSGSRTSFVDRFSAPNSSDLNAAMADENDDPLDARNLQRIEYASGVVARTEYFGTLSQLLRQEDWSKYIRSSLVTKFWSMRMSTEQRVITCSIAHSRLVMGAPLLVIKASPAGALSDLTPEQAALIQRVATLRRWLRQINACIGRYAALVAKLARLVDYLESLAVTSRNLAVGSSELSAALSARGETWFIPGETGTFGGMDVQAASLAFASTLSRQTEGNYLEQETIIEGVAVRNRGAVNTQGITGDLLLAYIGTEALVISPDVNWIQSLPTAATLMAWRSTALARYRGFVNCLSALRNDRALVERAIRDAQSVLRQTGVDSARDRSYVGYVTSIQETVATKNHTMQVTLSHVRPIGEDLNWDDLGGDDFEATVAFGEDGYLDDIYSIGRIGTEVYLPTFGCKSLADTSDVQSALARETQTPVRSAGGEAGPVGDASDIRAQMTHPTACGHSCLDEAAGALSTDPRLNLNFVARVITEAYLSMRERNVPAQQIVEYFEDLGARPGMTWADAFRGVPIVDPSDPVDSAARAVDGDSDQYPGAEPEAVGFFAETFPNPTKTDRQESVAGMRHSDEFTDNETDLLYSRQQAALRYATDAASKRRYVAND